MAKLKPRTHLTSSKATAEFLKRHTVYKNIDTPHGHRIIYDHGHPIVRKFVGSSVSDADILMRKRVNSNVGDRAYMRDVAKQANTNLGKRMVSSKDPALKGETHLMSTLIDHGKLTQFSAHLALSEELARKGLDASVVKVSPKKPKSKYQYMVFSSGKYVDIFEGKAHEPADIIHLSNVKELHTSRNVSKIRQPFDYDAAKPEVEARKRAISREKARKTAPTEREKGEQRIQEIEEQIQKLPTDQLSKVKDLRAQQRAIKSELPYMG